MNLIDKFYNEHRVAYSAIVEIENSEEPQKIRTEKILKLFSEELLPHFKQEEDELFTDDFGSRVLMQEHNEIYDLIKKMKVDKSGKDISRFCTLMKSHIQTEEAYFRELNNKNNNILPVIITAVIFFVIGLFISKTFSS